MQIVIGKAEPETLALYEKVSIGFSTASRVDLDVLRTSGAIAEIPMPERWKDYDEYEEDRPTALATRWDTTHWAVMLGESIGGAIVAMNTPGMNMLEAREDLALIMDLRIAPQERGKGVGRKLVEHAADWARRMHCTELRVETQDINVSACRFYSAVGFTVRSIEENAYEGLDEAKIVWAMGLQPLESGH